MEPIVITNLRNITTYTADYKFAIVRSYKKPLPGVAHMPQLSPSWELFRQYLALRNNNNWNKEMFDSFYVPQFVNGTLFTMSSRNSLHFIKKLYLEGKKVALACYCADEELCHRSIVGGFLEGIGCEVWYEQNTSYIHYCDNYKERLCILF